MMTSLQKKLITFLLFFTGIRRYNMDEGMCILWTDFALIVAQDTCTTSWQFCIFSSYNTWKKLW